MGAPRPAEVVLSVAGTNGKGSSVALLEAILLASGRRVGAYTSPHLLRFNERIRINGVAAEDAALCEAFQRVERARQATRLTYFEFGTLVALDLFARSGLDVAILEVGLGGRLDAVNIIDADACLLTQVGLDHMEFLGPDRDSIGREKAGIARAGSPAVCADPDPPVALLSSLTLTGARSCRVGVDYRFEPDPSGRAVWHWWSPGLELRGLPEPALPGAHQLANAAGVLALLDCLCEALPVRRSALETGLRTATLAGRCQRLPGSVELLLDVAHNRDSARALAQVLDMDPRPTRAVLAMLADKDAAGFAKALVASVDHWHVADLRGWRGCRAAELAATLRGSAGVAVAGCHDSVAAAARAALDASAPGERVVICGSFRTVAAFLEEWRPEPGPEASPAAGAGLGGV
jgi:dihydrofolate synthase/folylpolyglutamate synthase